MAQGAVALHNGAALTADELREILEYERIVQFRDLVLAGTHPRIKIPPHLASKHANNLRLVSSSTLSSTRPNPPTTGASHDISSATYNPSPNAQRQIPNNHLPLPSKPSRSEINPILLEKSEDLIKAEMQLQRQRLERALREQIEQQRVAHKALLQTSESLPSFDISEVLKEALTLTQPSTAAEVEPSVAIQSPASDSFDENTFYSSQHDTPEPSSSSQGSREQGEIVSQDLGVVHSHLVENLIRQPQAAEQEMAKADNPPSKNNLSAIHGHVQVQKSPSKNVTTVGLLHTAADMVTSVTGNAELERTSGSPVNPRINGSGTASTQPNNSTDSGSTSQLEIDRAATKKATEDLLKQAFEDEIASPLIRAHDLSPVAPQPARVSPLATAREPPVLRHAISFNGLSTQLRAPPSKQSELSSTDSSPSKGQKAVGKKERKKQKKRKAKDNPDTPDSPYIKPEPRSPSPFGVAPLPRPQKRPRQVGQYASELNYDEPRHEPQSNLQERIPQYNDLPVRRTDDRLDERYEPQFRRPEPLYQRVERDEREYRRVSDTQHARRPESPAVYAAPYSHGEVRPIRTVSHSVVDGRIAEEPRYYRESLPTISRPDADRERSRSPIMRERRSPIVMAPPRQPVRIVVDAYGREYIDPTTVAAARLSMAPPSRYREPEVIYERAPVRSVSTRPPIELNENGEVVYRRSPQPTEAPRRVITQPEYAQSEYRSYRQREYSTRPVAPPGEEYIQSRGAAERRQPTHFEEMPREYVAKAPSIRPEPVRYEIPREYVGRLQSVRPEPPMREYSMRPQPPIREYSVRPEPPIREYSVRPDIRREVAPQPQREYSVRPVDNVPRQETLPMPEMERRYEEAPNRRLIVPDGERSYEQMPGRRLIVEGERRYEEVPRRRLAEASFIERPNVREASVSMYGDDVRREVYR